MTIDKRHYKCDICKIPINPRYYDRPVCKEHRSTKETVLAYRLSKEAMLKGWTSFLDGLAKLPKDRRLFHISRLVRNSIITNELEKFFSDDELIQLTKLERKADIFKIKWEEHK